MPIVIAISSYVASGSVGLRAAHAVFERTPNRLISLPTVYLSAHLGHADVARHDIPTEVFASVLDRVQAQIGDEPVAGILTGFQPTRRHAELTAAFVTHVKQQWPACRVLVDPILGDDPDGLYVATDAAEGIRDDLVPVADIITPNRFELAWLSGQTISSIARAVTACRSLYPSTVLATSIDDGLEAIATLCVEQDQAHSVTTPQIDSRAHGTGDLFAALVLHHMILGAAPSNAMAHAVASVTAALAATGQDHDIALTNVLFNVTPLNLEPVTIEGREPA